jgi:hypothetical protein
LPAQPHHQDQDDRQRRDHPNPRLFHVTAGKIREIGGRRPDNNDGDPVIGLMHAAIEAFDDHHERKRGCEKRKAGDVAQSHIAGNEVAHIGAKDARKAERDPVSRAERRQMDVPHWILLEWRMGLTPIGHRA